MKSFITATTFIAGIASAATPVSAANHVRTDAVSRQYESLVQRDAYAVQQAAPQTRTFNAWGHTFTY